MSIASVPGFGVLFPSGSYAGAEPTASTTQNPYQQQLSTLESWQNQVLQESLSGNTTDATDALYASAGLNADQFANLAAQLQNLESSGTAGSSGAAASTDSLGSNIDTTA